MASSSGNQKLKPEKMLKTLTTGYTGPVALAPFRNFMNVNRPVFQRHIYVPQMLKDPRVSFGLKLIKGPILSKAKFIIESDSDEVHDYLVRQVDRFWTKGAPVSMDSMVYGFSGSEVLYRFDPTNSVFNFHGLKYLHPGDVRPLKDKKNDVISHMSVKRVKGTSSSTSQIYLPRPKFFWTVHNKSFNRFFGQSRLEGAFIPWFEQWMPRGYRQIRQMWFYKNAYSSCVIKFPQGSTKETDGSQRPNISIANEMADRYITGSSLCLPSSPEGDNAWDFEPAKGNPIPDGLLEYGEVLGDEVWEGLGIPPEVVSADGTGAFAGRRVPQQAFYSVLQEIVDEHIYDFDEQVLRPLVNLNFGQVPYEIKTKSILDTLQEEEMGLVTGSIGDDPEAEEGGEEGGQPQQRGKAGPPKIEDRNTEHNRKEKAVSANNK